MIFSFSTRRGAPTLLSTLSLSACVLAAPHALAGRPMTVDDAAIAAPGQCQLESYFQHAAGVDQYWAMPACNVGGDWELAAGGAWSGDAPGQGRRGARLGRLQAKTVFKPLEANGWGLGLVLASQFRAGDAASGELSANVPLSVSFNDDAVLAHVNLGALRRGLPGAPRAGDGGMTSATWGGGAQVKLGERDALTAEAYGQQRGGGRYQFGVAHALVPDRVQLDATWGRRLARGGGEPAVSLGLVFQSQP